MTSTRGVALRPLALGVLAGLGLAWSLGVGRTEPLHADGAISAPATAEPGSGVIAFTTAGQGSSQLLYLIDTRTQAFAVYRVDPQELKGTVKLEAARQYRWDLKLGEYNNAPPEVSAVEAMVGTPRR
jgi:hypothetical protein